MAVQIAIAILRCSPTNPCNLERAEGEREETTGHSHGYGGPLLHMAEFAFSTREEKTRPTSDRTGA